jgi:chorismate mutase-like protein
MDNARLAGDAELPPARLARLIDMRLALMTEVARWKWNRKSPIVDLARESAQMESLRGRGAALGLEPELIETFFGAQVSASKVMQTELFARWRHDGAGEFAGVLDLDRELRPLIDSVTADILAVLGKWDGKPTVREHLGLYNANPQRSCPGHCVATFDSRSEAVVHFRATKHRACSLVPVIAVSLLASDSLWPAAAPAFRVLVTNERTGTLSVLDGLTSKVIATVPLGKRPGAQDVPRRQAVVCGIERLAHCRARSG